MIGLRAWIGPPVSRQVRHIRTPCKAGLAKHLDSQKNRFRRPPVRERAGRAKSNVVWRQRKVKADK